MFLLLLLLASGSLVGCWVEQVNNVVNGCLLPGMPYFKVLNVAGSDSLNLIFLDGGGELNWKWSPPRSVVVGDNTTLDITFSLSTNF